MIANEKNPLLFVSMHMNHYSVDRYSGFEIYYQEGNVPSQGLAYNIADEVKGSVPDAGNRTPKATDQLYLLSNITCPAVLVECGFLSNRPECERLCEKEYEKRLEAHNREYGEILAEADHDWENTIFSAVFAFVLMLVFCVINLKLFPVCSNMLAQTQTVVSSLKIIHIMQLLFVGAAVVFFYMAYSEEVIAWSGLGCWMLCIAATLLNKKRFGIQETEDASPVQDLTAWLTLPLKVSLSLLAVIFSFGILFLIYTICRIEYSVEPFFRFGIIVSALPLGIYLNYLLSVYSLEIGLAIISVPRLLRNNKSK
jgi:hypothetical protein